MPVRGVACINDLITGLPAVITPYLFLSLSFYLSPSVLKGLCQPNAHTNSQLNYREPEKGGGRGQRAMRDLTWVFEVQRGEERGKSQGDVRGREDRWLGGGVSGEGESETEADRGGTESYEGAAVQREEGSSLCLFISKCFESFSRAFKWQCGLCPSFNGQAGDGPRHTFQGTTHWHTVRETDPNTTAQQVLQRKPRQHNTYAQQTQTDKHCEEIPTDTTAEHSSRIPKPLSVSSMLSSPLCGPLIHSRCFLLKCEETTYHVKKP